MGNINKIINSCTLESLSHYYTILYHVTHNALHFIFILVHWLDIFHEYSYIRGGGGSGFGV